MPAQDDDMPFLLVQDHEEEEVFSSLETPISSSALEKTSKEVFSSLDNALESTSSAFHTPRPATSHSSSYGAIKPSSKSSTLATASQPYVGPSTSQRSTTHSTPYPDPVHIAILGAHDEILHDLPWATDRMLIGRQHTDLFLDDPFVSKWHAQIFRQHGIWMLEDMNSQNGVYLRIADEFALEHGDEIVMGQQHFIYNSHAQPYTHTHIREHTDKNTDKNTVRIMGSPAPPQFPHLIHMLDKGLLGGIYPIQGSTSVGHTSCQVSCPQDRSLEAKHATFELREGKAFLRDHNSLFGTYIRVNNAIELINGDYFLIGRTRLRIHY